MNQGKVLSRPVCARNAGVAILVRTLIVTLVFFALNLVLDVPGETTMIAAENIKANFLFLILVAVAIFALTFTSLPIAFPLNNVLTRVNKNLSKWMAYFRLLDALIFAIGTIILFSGISFFNVVLLVGQIFYALHLILLGYLIINSGFLNRLLGIPLIVGGAAGYLLEIVIRFSIPSISWVSTIGIAIGIIAEVSLGIYLLMTAFRMFAEDPDPKVTIRRILEDLGSASTTEIIEEASMVSHTCKDRIPKTLVTLETEKAIAKEFSKEKKGYVWTLVS